MNKQPDVTAATKKRMTEAFLELYKAKPIEKISVNEITRLSGNNRSTFYNYFTDVYDLLDQLENDVLDNVAEEIEEAAKNIASEDGGKTNFSNMYGALSPVLLKYEDLLFTLSGPDGDPKFADMLKSRVEKNLVKFSPVPIDNKYIDYLANFVFGSIIGMIAYWRRRDHDIPQDELLHLAQNLTARGIFGFIEDEAESAESNNTEDE